MSRGNVTRRGKSSWRLKFDIADAATGERHTQFVTVRGTKREAEAELGRRLSQVEEGTFVERAATTVGQYAKHWIETIAPAKASAKTRERYGELINKHIVPHLGKYALQKLDGSRIDEFYSHLRTSGRLDGKGGLSPLTVLHMHRLLSQILASAVKARKLRQSPMGAVQTTPKARQEEIQILDDGELAGLLRSLRGSANYMPVLTAASTGMRRGEVLALRWRDIDLDHASLNVSQVLEQTKEGLSIKEPKTTRSRRSIALPATLVAELRQHRRSLAEMRLRLGLGKDDRDLVFPAWDGSMRDPRAFSKEFARDAKQAGVGHVTFHGLRHTHITSLLRSGVPVHIVSARAGHANPAITLNVYSHALPGQQETAAALIDSALRRALEE